MVDADLLGTDRFAVVGVRAASETFRIHLGHHGFGALIALGLALRKIRQMRDFRGAKSDAEAFLQTAMQAAQPMQEEASMARSAFGLGIGIMLASGVPPVFTDTKPPAC